MKYTIYIVIVLWPVVGWAQFYNLEDTHQHLIGEEYSRKAEAERQEEIIRLQKRQIQLLEQQEQREREKEHEEDMRHRDENLHGFLDRWAAEGK